MEIERIEGTKLPVVADRGDLVQTKWNDVWCFDGVRWHHVPECAVEIITELKENLLSLEAHQPWGGCSDAE